MAALATAPDVEAVLGRDLTLVETTRVERLLELASSRVRRVARQTISLVEDDVVALGGDGTDTLWLPERPVVEISAITSNGVVVDAGQYAWADDGSLVRAGYAWGYGVPLSVTYSHGYAQIPLEVVEIVAALVAARLARGSGEDANVTSHSIGGFSETLAEPAFTISNEDRKYLRGFAPPIMSVPITTRSDGCPSSLY